MKTHAENLASSEAPNFVDLSELENFSFGTAWDTSSQPSTATPKKSRSDRPSKHASKGFSQKPFSEDKRKGKPGMPDKRTATPFKPVCSVSFVPDKRSFDVVLSAVRKSRRAYKLFSIAHLMLQKPERFQVCLKPLEDEEAKKMSFFVCKLDGVPFDSEKAVVHYAFHKHNSVFFKTESVPVELPKGAFTMIARCSLTKKLLGPPNYHRYSSILKHHYDQHCSRVSWESFLKSIETLKDESLLNEWMESIKEETHYISLDQEEGKKPEVFRDEQDAIKYLSLNKKDQIFEEKSKTQFSAQLIETMPRGVIRRSVESVLSRQRKFPLETTRALVPVLRQARFFLFKSSGPKVTYVSAVKRKRLESSVPLSASVTQLLSIIAQTPECTREKLLIGDQKDVRSRDLTWLISEGYVVEYEDGNIESLSPASPKKETTPPASKSEKSAHPVNNKEAQPTPVPTQPTLMTIQPKIRGFVCVTAHPTGCAAHIQDQQRRLSGLSQESGPKKVLVLGCSTGYGLSSRLTAALGYKADTFGVYFERPPSAQKPASAGWYNNWALEQEARKQGLYAESLNGDAFSKEIKEQTLKHIAQNMGPIDLVIYSLAAPRRTDPDTQEVYKSVLKPVGAPFTSKTLNTDKDQVTTVNLEAASQEDIEATRKVMGGEDWALWMQALQEAKLLAPGAKTVAYSYIGPELTFPIYKNGTIGLAKKHLEQTAKALQKQLAPSGAQAWVAINKCIVTQASSAIPVVPLYASILYKVMKEKGIHEDALDQIKRLFSTQLYSPQGPKLDEEGRIRMDDLELRQDVQEAIAALWPQIETENLRSLSDYSGYQEAFLQLFGFNWPGVDYDQPVSCIPEAFEALVAAT